jgi:hypothetical protein
MSGVFRTIDPTPPHRPACVYPPPPAFGAGGGHTRWVERGWGVNSWEDARHCSVLYICKYFVHYRKHTCSIREYAYIEQKAWIIIIYNRNYKEML